MPRINEKKPERKERSLSSSPEKKMTSLECDVYWEREIASKLLGPAMEEWEDDTNNHIWQELRQIRDDHLSFNYNHSSLSALMQCKETFSRDGSIVIRSWLHALIAKCSCGSDNCYKLLRVCFPEDVRSGDHVALSDDQGNVTDMEKDLQQIPVGSQADLISFGEKIRACCAVALATYYNWIVDKVAPEMVRGLRYFFEKYEKKRLVRDRRVSMKRRSGTEKWSYAIFTEIIRTIQTKSGHILKLRFL